MSKSKKDVGAIVRKSGVSFRVWAPFADSVAIIGSFNNWSETTLNSEKDGYWSVVIRGAKAGQEYKFVIRSGSQVYYRNDPRALHFPTSAGCSVIVDDWFDWGDDTFTPIPLEQQVIYELHVGTFNRPDSAITGTFRDVTDKLDYLAELGINMIELMPISTMMTDRGWGYAIDYIFAIESLYGGRHGFLEFVKAAHKRGIGIILDVVYNHFGPGDNLDLWQFDGWNQDNKGGIYFYNDWRADTPWGNTRPDFGRPEVRQYILDNVRMWMHDCRVDGLRLDSTIYIRNVKGNNNDPANDLAEGWKLLQEITSEVKKINSSAVTIAEDLDCNDFITKPQFEGGAGFSAQWSLSFPKIIRETLKHYTSASIDLSPISSILSRNFNGKPYQSINFIDSHDTAANGSARFNEIIAPKKSGDTFAKQQSLIAATILLSAPGVPMLFQGQEFLEEGSFNDWQGLDWEKLQTYSGINLAYKHLIALRKNNYGLSTGLTGEAINIFHRDDDNKVLAYHRWKNGGNKDDTIVIINFSNSTLDKYNIKMPRSGLWRVRFNSNWKGYSQEFKGIEVSDVQTSDNNEISIILPPRTAIILSQD